MKEPSKNKKTQASSKGHTVQSQAHKRAFAAVDSKQSLPTVEHEMLDFWEKESIFEKSVEARKGEKKFVFFDGPPFANGLPHYGHILANSLKDAVTRYQTMRGFYVPRTNGWDCHGLPVEYEIEKELKISGRKEIEKMGVAKFNAECRKSVFRYTEEWEKLLKRIGRWVDFGDSYATLENTYMESIWWVFKEIWKKGLVYQGYKPMHICPRCETSLSNFEVTLGYKEVTDLSVTVKFELVDEPGTYFVAWTTTPWSTVSTMALAIGPDFDYVKVKMEDGQQYYLAKDRAEAVFNGLGTYEVLKTVKGKELVGKKYIHPFDFYVNTPEVKKSKNAYRTIATDYVSTQDGTGIVTVNGAFGEIDFEAATKNELPIFVNVGTDGHFKEETGQFSGIYVKEAQSKIVDYLIKKNALLRKDSITHSYPHCWRCDTPLINYATRSWFVKVTDIKKKLLKNNEKIHWVPSHIQDGRFGKWLEGARDWNISRNRFWGCPIPVWECEKGHQTCIGSVKELRQQSHGGNTFIFVRHGEAEHNVKHILNSNPKNIYHLTENGKAQAKKTAAELSKEHVDMIFSSPFARAHETADIIGKALNKEIQLDQHLVEHHVGSFEGKPSKEFLAEFPSIKERYHKKVAGAESFKEVETRVSQFMDFLNRKYAGKTFVIVTHGNVVRAALHSTGEHTLEEVFATLPDYAAAVKIQCGKLPKRNDELDLHKPYIDEINLTCEECSGPMKRIPEVLDCWFESGSMPYAQLHYPFENKTEFESNFPANFIAEGLDQTRGWFYTLHVLATLLFDKPAFQNVIVNGILLAADGEKLSKRKKNYPDPSLLFETHGVDSTRFFLYTSTAPEAQDVRFSEKHVEEIVKQFTLTLWNTYSFFVTYANIDGWTPSEEPNAHTSTNKLDKWILSELHELITTTTQGMEAYNLTQATRPMMAFVDNLSNWYVRRNRRRFWKSGNDADKSAAYQTLYTVLTEFAKLLAPFMPFVSESIFKNLTGKESVHLENWPTANPKMVLKDLNEEVKAVRTIVSLALRVRSKQNLKVRQPLALLRVAVANKSLQKVLESYEDVILEELNVKKMSFESEGNIAVPSITVNSRKIGPRFGKETQEIIGLSKKGDYVMQKDGSVHLPKTGKAKYVLNADEVTIGYQAQEGFDVESQDGILVSLDTKVTDELRHEGYCRDIVRYIQELRKKANYDISDKIYVFIDGPKEIKDAVTQFAEVIQRETLALEIQEGGDFEWDEEQEVEVDGNKVKVGVRK